MRLYITLLGDTALTITTRLLSDGLVEHERQPHEERDRPVRRDVLTNTLRRVGASEHLRFLMVDDMNIANIRDSYWRWRNRTLKSTQPVQSAIPFC